MHHYIEVLYKNELFLRLFYQISLAILQDFLLFNFFYVYVYFLLIFKWNFSLHASVVF